MRQRPDAQMRNEFFNKIRQKRSFRYSCLKSKQNFTAYTQIRMEATERPPECTRVDVVFAQPELTKKWPAAKAGQARRCAFWGQRHCSWELQWRRQKLRPRTVKTNLEFLTVSSDRSRLRDRRVVFFPAVNALPIFLPQRSTRDAVRPRLTLS